MLGTSRTAAMTLSVIVWSCLWSAFPAPATADGTDFSLQQILGYPYPSELTAAPAAGTVAWVLDQRGVRNIWVAAAPDFTPRQVTSYSADDGQELSNLAFSMDGQYLVFVRGGDHDANWPSPQQPGPDSSTAQPQMQVLCINLKDSTVKTLGQGDMPAIAPDSSRIVFIHMPEQSVWWSPLDGSAKAQQLFFDRGHAGDLQWSPDGKALAYVSERGDHSFVGVFRDQQTPVQYLAPAATLDSMPRWSPDGTHIAFVRQPGNGGEPEPILKQVPHPWSLWVSDVGSGTAQPVWQSPATMRGSYPDTAGEVNLHWLKGDQLLFLADLDNWPHLYTVPAQGGQARLLTPGKFMVEHVAVSADHAHVAYSANTGASADDQDRRHLYALTADGGAPHSVTAGEGIEWTPVIAGDNRTLAFIQTGVRQPPLVSVGDIDGHAWKLLGGDSIPADYPSASFVTPKSVSFKAADGLLVHGQLFARADGTAQKPAVIFVHGGPVRQMLLGWHYMDYYSNAYAMNQYLANHGFVVLALNYRLGIGYGQDFMHPAHWGPTGAAEYKDVLAAAHFLQRERQVDAKKIGIWGGSYGGFLTAMALARDSATFKAGVDLHGVHDWSFNLAEWLAGDKPRYQEGDRKQAMHVAWLSSPDAYIRSWRSPVLLIQGDDDRNVHFHEMVDMVNRLQQQHVPYEQLVLPNEIHGFLRYQSWLTADSATVEFLARKLQTRPK